MSQSFENYLQEVAGSPEDEFNAALAAEIVPAEETIDPNYTMNNDMLIDAMNEIMGSRGDGEGLSDIYDKRILELIDAVTLG